MSPEPSCVERTARDFLAAINGLEPDFNSNTSLVEFARRRLKGGKRCVKNRGALVLQAPKSAFTKEIPSAPATAVEGSISES